MRGVGAAVPWLEEVVGTRDQLEHQWREREHAIGGFGQAATLLRGLGDQAGEGGMRHAVCIIAESPP
jgi:hypothetical protein